MNKFLSKEFWELVLRAVFAPFIKVQKPLPNALMFGQMAVPLRYPIRYNQIINKIMEVQPMPSTKFAYIKPELGDDDDE